MKELVFVAIAILLSGCSGTDDNGGDGGSSGGSTGADNNDLAPHLHFGNGMFREYREMSPRDFTTDRG